MVRSTEEPGTHRAYFSNVLGAELKDILIRRGFEREAWLKALDAARTIVLAEEADRLRWCRAEMANLPTDQAILDNVRAQLDQIAKRFISE